MAHASRQWISTLRRVAGFSRWLSWTTALLFLAAAGSISFAVWQWAMPLREGGVIETSSTVTLLKLGQSLRSDIARVVSPAMERTRLLAASSEVVEALRAGNVKQETNWCNRAIQQATEVDAIAVFDSRGKIAAINNVYSDGHAIPAERVDRIFNLNFDHRDIIQKCVKNDANEQILEFQTSCDITPAFFDSTGLSVAISVPVFEPSTHLKLGVVSTRLKFERLTALSPRDPLIDVEFITDQGGYFSEEINSGKRQPPVPTQVLQPLIQPLARGDVDDCFTRIGSDYLLFFRPKNFFTIQGGGIQVMLRAGEEWLTREARQARNSQCAAFLGLGIMLVLATFLILGVAAIRRSELWNRLLIETAFDAVVTTDSDGITQSWNPQCEKVFGFTEKEAVGRSLASLIFPDTLRFDLRDRFCCPIDAGARGMRSRRIEVTAMRKDGTEIAIELAAAPVPTGRGARFCIVLRDITERKITQGKLIQAQKLESIGHLAAGIAHEINTPTQYVGDNTRFIRESFISIMTLVGRYHDLLANDAASRLWKDRLDEIETFRKELDVEFLTEEIPKALEQSISGLDCIATIVRAMKDFSHPGGDTKEPADLNHAIRSTATVCRNRWKYVAELEFDLDPGLPDVQVQLGEFNQVILNLIVNAADAVGDSQSTAKGESTEPVAGRIKISSKSLTDSQVEIRVNDNGSGIPESARARIFEPFFTTKPVGKGTGQGLMLCRNVIVNKHGGELFFETQEGRGTTFVIRLPVDSSPAHAVEHKEAA